MGFGVDTIAKTGATPFWQSIVQGNLSMAPEMGFWLARPGRDSYQGSSGTLTLGGRDQELYVGDVEFLPLIAGSKGGTPGWPLDTGTGWPLNVSGMYLILPRPTFGFSHPRASITGVTVNKNIITLPPGSIAYISIGSTVIAGPDAVVAAIYAQIPNSEPLSGNHTGDYGFRMSIFYHP